jgi:uncharacterized OsmC-like protein
LPGYPPSSPRKIGRDTVDEVENRDARELQRRHDRRRARHGRDGTFTFRAHTEWFEGARSQTSIQRFRQPTGEDFSRQRPFRLISDEPHALGGLNQGPSPLELLLASLGAALTAGMARHADARRIRIDRLQCDIEGSFDLAAYETDEQEVDAGAEDREEDIALNPHIQVVYRIDCRTAGQELADLIRHVEATSPLMKILRKGLPVSSRTETFWDHDESVEPGFDTVEESARNE